MKRKLCFIHSWGDAHKVYDQPVVLALETRCTQDVQLGKGKEVGATQSLPVPMFRLSWYSDTAGTWCLLGHGLSFNADTVTWNLVAGLELLAVSTSSPVPGVSHLLGLAWPCIPEL